MGYNCATACGTRDASNERKKTKKLIDGFEQKNT